MRYACKICLQSLKHFISYDIESAEYACIISISYAQRLHLTIANIYKRYNITSYSWCIVYCSSENKLQSIRRGLLRICARTADQLCKLYRHVSHAYKKLSSRSEWDVRMSKILLHRDAQYTADMKYDGNKWFRWTVGRLVRHWWQVSYPMSGVSNYMGGSSAQAVTHRVVNTFRINTRTQATGSSATGCRAAINCAENIWDALPDDIARGVG